VDNPEAVSVNTIRLLDVGVPAHAIGVGADGIEDRDLSQPLNPWASARSTSAVCILLVILVPLPLGKAGTATEKGQEGYSCLTANHGNARHGEMLMFPNAEFGETILPEMLAPSGPANENSP